MPAAISCFGSPAAPRPSSFAASRSAAGDWKTPTERRLAPGPLPRGARIAFPNWQIPILTGRVVRTAGPQNRLVWMRFDGTPAEIVSGLYRTGRPIQYAHEPTELELRQLQTAFATAPLSAEEPSATTSVARALEAVGQRFRDASSALSGTTRLRIGPEHRLRVVRGLLTGIHDPTESHHRLLQAFAPPHLLAEADRRADEEAYRRHEAGDRMLIFSTGLWRPNLRWCAVQQSAGGRKRFRRPKLANRPSDG